MYVIIASALHHHHHHHVIIMSSCHHVIIMSSSCHHHVIIITARHATGRVAPLGNIRGRHRHTAVCVWQATWPSCPWRQSSPAE
jgi:hypothetical protein